MIIGSEGIKPKMGTNVFIVPPAAAIGGVEIKVNPSIWL
jgi:carbonic anhydrase/acetyltransferase-like protein (isoleucine patch superfamily)